MFLTKITLFNDRQQAAHLLAEKLMPYKNTDAIVAGVGSGGAVVGFSVAKELNLPFEMVFCRRIDHPADPSRTVGSLTDDQVLLHDCSYDIPQNFFIHNVARLQYEIKRDYKFLYGEALRPSFQGKIVILVADLIDTSDTLLAALKSVKAQKPQQVIVSAPIIVRKAAVSIAKEVDELIFLQMESEDSLGKNYYEDYPRVELKEVKRLWLKSAQKSDDRASVLCN